jgi:hypothetical protein
VVGRRDGLLALAFVERRQVAEVGDVPLRVLVDGPDDGQPSCRSQPTDVLFLDGLSRAELLISRASIISSATHTPRVNATPNLQ